MTDGKKKSKQLINAELAARKRNIRDESVLMDYIPSEEQDGVKIAFQCECSDTNCHERVSLTIEQYEDLHKNKANFVLIKGHEEPKVEKVEDHVGRYSIVTKDALK